MPGGNLSPGRSVELSAFAPAATLDQEVAGSHPAGRAARFRSVFSAPASFGITQARHSAVFGRSPLVHLLDLGVLGSHAPRMKASTSSRFAIPGGANLVLTGVLLAAIGVYDAQAQGSVA